MNDKRDIAVIGLGTFGEALARELTRLGDRVIGLDQDGTLVSALDGVLDTVMEGDASDPRVLEHMAIDGFDAVIIAIGDNMQASLLAAMHAREAGCSTLYVKAQTPEHAQILKAIGVTNLFLPEQSFARHAAQRIHNPRLVDVLRFSHGGEDEMEGGLQVASVCPPPRTVGRTVADLNVSKYALTCLAVADAQGVRPGPCDDHTLQEESRLLLLGKRADLRRFADAS